MIFIDTNIFLRVLLNDHASFSKACRILLKKIEAGTVHAVTTDLVVAELVFILQKQTQIPLTRRDIFRMLNPILSINDLSTPSKKHWEAIFEIYVQKNIDFIDAYNMVVMRSEGIEKAYSYDHDFDKAGVLKRIEP